MQRSNFNAQGCMKMQSGLHQDPKTALSPALMITSGRLYYPYQVNYSTSPTEGIVKYPIVAKSGGDLFPNTTIIPYGK